MTGYTLQDDNGGEPLALVGLQLACVADHDIGIYEEGAIQTAPAKVIKFASQNHFELKCRGAVNVRPIPIAWYPVCFYTLVFLDDISARFLSATRV